MRSAGNAKSKSSVRIPLPLIAAMAVAYNRHIATFDASINVTPTGIIQVKQGIGDVIWHLPFIRAIAAAAPHGVVTFLTLPSTHARELLQAEPCIAETIYFAHGGSEFERGRHLLGLVGLLRRSQFRTLWILDRTIRPALAAWLAGIPERIGLGLGPQRWLITNAGIDHSHFHDQPIDWLRALMTAMKVPPAGSEPDLKLPPALVQSMAVRFRDLPHPWIVLGIGASRAEKDWPDDHWAQFVASLRRLTSGTLFLIGGAGNATRAQGFLDRSAGGASAVNACNLSVVESAALLRLAGLFVGADSGPMNLAVAAGIPTFALFGTTPVLTYSKHIHAVLPDDGRGPGPGGMARISPAQVMVRIERYLAAARGSG
jgi:heptosyltransferase-2